MARVIHYFAHPGQSQSRANRALWHGTKGLQGVTRVDLYADYPRFDIDVPREQGRLDAHDVIVFQFPVFWYSSPALVKEWQDLVLEHGYAYGRGGTALTDKVLMLALTAAGPAEAYAPDGYQRFDLRTFLTPLEQTARLCGMRFAPPYVLFGALRATEGRALETHAEGFRRLIEALRDDRFDHDAAHDLAVLGADTLPLMPETA